jgi:hypothetical protein
MDGTQMQPVSIRLDEPSLKALDGIREHLASQNPGWSPTRSDAVRFAIANSYSVAAPIAGSIPDGEAPMRARR